MPFFRYTATDAQGKTLSGTVQAKSPQAAEGVLAGRGYLQVSLVAPGATGAQRDVIRTRRVGDRDLMFCFSQAASMIRAGMSPFEAFGAVGERTGKPALCKACLDIAANAGEGRYPSAVMERYIDVFPHNAVAMARAGEYGGFLPEVLEYLAQHYADSAAFKRWFWILRLATWQGIVLFAFAIPLPPALWQAFHEGAPMPRLLEIYFGYLLFPTLPILAAVLVGYCALMAILRSHAFTRKRHAFVLRLPWGIGGRARNESIRTFLWTLRNVSKGGVPPGTAWPLAAGSVPNAEYALRLFQAGKLLGSERPLSDAMVATALFPHDYDVLLRTAEQTGDVVGTLDRMLVLTDEELETNKLRARVGLYSIGCLLLLICGGAALIYLSYQYYGRVFQEVDKYMESNLMHIPG